MQMHAKMGHPATHWDGIPTRPRLKSPLRGLWDFFCCAGLLSPSFACAFPCSLTGTKHKAQSKKHGVTVTYLVRMPLLHPRPRS